MGQVLHIFRKDLRRFWPEASTSLLATTAFAALYPAQWQPATPFPIVLLGLPLGHASLQTVASFATAVVPIAWFILFVRVVQDECLVGERPYWFTRPYEWPKLLAAKTLFLFLFAVLPLLIAQWILLSAAGFEPTHYLGLLLLNVFVNVGTFMLPILCLAVVTRNFLRASLTLLGFFAVIGGIAALSSYLPSTSLPYNDHISIPLMIAVFTAVVFVQYSSRTTWLARSILIVLALTVTALAINPLESYLIDHVYYPPATLQDDSLATLTLARDSKRQPTVSSDAKDDETLTLPIDISAVPYGDILEADDARVRIIAANGSTWTSPWHAFYNHSYTARTQKGTVDVKVDHTFYEQARKAPVKFELTLAVTALQAGQASRFQMPTTGDLVIPGFGRCANQLDSGLHCRYPLTAPPRMLLTAYVTDNPCPKDGTPPPETFPLTASPGTLKHDAVDDGLTSVWDADVPLTYFADTDMQVYNVPRTYLCPGSLVSVAAMHVLRRARYTLSAADYILPAPRTFQQLITADPDPVSPKLSSPGNNPRQPEHHPK